MIALALTAVEETITDLPWVERYGGVAIPATHIDQQVITDGDTVMTVAVPKTFPVQCGLTGAECWQGGKYRNLIPNSKYASLLYWEITSGVQRVNSNKLTGKEWALEGTARLVYWLNLPKLGYGTGAEDAALQSPCMVGDLAALELMRTVEGQYTLATDTITAARVELRNPRMAVKSTAVFGQYSYGEEVDAMMMYPYDFGAIDWTVTVTLNVRNCVLELPTGAELTCVTEW